MKTFRLLSSLVAMLIATACVVGDNDTAGLADSDGQGRTPFISIPIIAGLVWWWRERRAPGPIDAD